MVVTSSPALVAKDFGPDPGKASSTRANWRIAVTPSLCLLVLLGLCIVWALWPNLISMYRKWLRDPRYSHGILVPFFAAVLWKLRMPKTNPALQANWWGFALILTGSLVQLAGSFVFIEWLETFSVVIYAAGLVTFWGGTKVLRWAWAPLAYLIFMIPLPYRIETAMGWPLQRTATVASTYLLQTMGLSAGAEGNTIVLPGGRIGVVEACNGLGILFTFLATASAVALSIDRPVWQKWLVVASGGPIALMANVTRITLTGYLHETAGGPVADMVYHDLAGWLMMPFALLMLWAELSFASLLMMDAEPLGTGDLT